MKRQIIIVGMLAALGPLAAIGIAQNNNRTSANDPNTDSTVPTADRNFAQNAAQGGIAEVKLGELAEKNGGTQQVKDFGKRMVEDHSKANGELTLDAAKENIQLPTQMDSRDQATYDRLSKLNGAAFDRAYARDMVSDHQKDISDFQKEANNGKNPIIKNFAAQTTPVLQEHLKLARAMQQSTSQSSSAKTTKSNRAS